MLQETLLSIYNKKINITICICDHQARDLLACVDIAMILSVIAKIIAQDTPNLILLKILMPKMHILEIAFKFN